MWMTGMQAAYKSLYITTHYNLKLEPKQATAYQAIVETLDLNIF